MRDICRPAADLLVIMGRFRYGLTKLYTEVDIGASSLRASLQCGARGSRGVEVGQMKDNGGDRLDVVFYMYLFCSDCVQAFVVCSVMIETVRMYAVSRACIMTDGADWSDSGELTVQLGCGRIGGCEGMHWVRRLKSCDIGRTSVFPPTNQFRPTLAASALTHLSPLSPSPSQTGPKCSSALLWVSPCARRGEYISGTDTTCDRSTSAPNPRSAHGAFRHLGTKIAKSPNSGRDERETASALVPTGPVVTMRPE